MLIKIFLFFSIIFSSFTVGESLYEFDSIEDEKRFYTLIKEIRCPKCTSGSLASSNAPVSEDIKSKIIELKNKNWMVNSRVNGKGYRYSHVSSDMGKTWGSQLRNDLIDPGCNASLINYDGDILLFSNVSEVNKGSL